MLVRVLDDCLGPYVYTLSNSEAYSPNRSQEDSGRSFKAILELARQIALRRPLEIHL